jgi:hypothetical protein
MDRDYANCNRAAFDHDMHNLQALREVAEQAQRTWTRGFITQRVDKGESQQQILDDLKY